MRIVRTKELKDEIELTVRISRKEKLLAVDESSLYKLGYPIEDIVPSHVVAESVPVVWCPTEQRWVDK
jgi:hypothetical protein